MKKLFRALFNRLFFDFARKGDLVEAQDQCYRQLASWIQIQRFLGKSLILKPMRGWALSPDAILHVLLELQARPQPLLFEFGSGQSTIILAAYLQIKGAGRIISIEHDPVYADQIQKQIQQSGLEKHVELRVVPLEPKHQVAASKGCLSYNLDDLTGADHIDVALIDGPPEKNGQLTRYFPLIWALDRLCPGGVAFLDDAHRANERLVIQEVARQRPGFLQEDFVTEKGLHGFRRTP